MSELSREVELPVTADEAFRWHQREGAFERLTPPWEQVRVVEPAKIEDGSRARLRMRLGPLHTDWVAEHRDVRFGERFVDVQVQGPFAAWRHEHLFEPGRAEGESRLVDCISYRLPLGGLGLAKPVERRLERMFRYRHDVVKGDLRAHKELSKEPLQVGITGASGLIGSSLLAFLQAGGHGPRGLPRRPKADDLEGLDAVVHLAGEPLMGVRWTKGKKRRIYESRAQGTAHLARTLAAMPRGPRVFLCASGINYYGDRGEEPLDEEKEPGDGFLAEVCQAWEDATLPAREAGIRVVSLRTGVVLTPKGGALPLLALPYRLGVGGPLGRKDAYFSFLSLDDHLDILLRCLADERLAGPVNAVTDAPVTHAELAAALARVLQRPNLLPVPPFVLRAALGTEMAEAMLLSSLRVVPKKLLDVGHTFRTRTIDETLRQVLGRQA